MPEPAQENTQNTGRDRGGTARTYRDRWITCTDSEVQIRGYYFPWGTKHISYGSIEGLTRVKMGPLTGRGRIWGTANPRYWASFDPGRPRKQVGLILDLGKRVKPFVTPDDPDAFEAVLVSHTGISTAEGGESPGQVV
jgi:hypothetical protein